MKKDLFLLNPDQHKVTAVPKITNNLPFFNLTLRKKEIPKVIKYHGVDQKGRPIIWEVHPNTSKEIGPPGVEAHQVWTLLIKPAIDAHRRPDGSIPDIIPLGRLLECLRKVGWTIGGHQANRLIKAFTQISFAGCVAEFYLPTGQIDENGEEICLFVNARYSRLGVYAIGEYHVHPDDLAAAKLKYKFDLEDTVYISLDRVEIKLLENQDPRFVDNEYMFSVKPAARRWYELVSAKIFGVIKNKGKYCEILYSWYVKHHHTLKRYQERSRMVFQMDRIVKEHLESSYITKVEYSAIEEPGQEIDFLIRYYPGEKAKQSIERILAYTRQNRQQSKRYPSASPSPRPAIIDIKLEDSQTLDAKQTRPKSKKQSKVSDAGSIKSSEQSKQKERLIEELVSRGADRKWAASFMGAVKSENLVRIEDLIQYFDQIVKADKKKVKSPGGFLRTMLEQGWTLPPNFQPIRQSKEKTEQEQKQKKSQKRAFYYPFSSIEEADRVYTAWFNREVDAAIATKPGKEIELLRNQVKEAMNEQHGRLLRSWTAEIKAEFFDQAFRKQIAKELNLIDFDQWLEEKRSS